jgi:hypothetical protein
MKRKKIETRRLFHFATDPVFALVLGRHRPRTGAIEPISAHGTRRRNEGDVRDTSALAVLALVGAPVASGERGPVADIAPCFSGKGRDDFRMHRQQHLDPAST